MVVKYQLVFAKIESSFAKIFNSNRQRNKRMQARAFSTIRMHAITKTKELSYKSHLIYMKLQDSLVRKVCETFIKNRGQTAALRGAFFKWKNVSVMTTLMDKFKLQLQKDKNEL
jgi:predicted sugar kinase